MAEKEFDAFLTTDKGIPHQQNLADLDLTIILLRAKSNDYEDLSPLMDEVNAKLQSVRTGTLLRIPSPPQDTLRSVVRGSTRTLRKRPETVPDNRSDINRPNKTA